MPIGIYKRIIGVNCGLPTQGLQKGHKVNLGKKNALGKHWKLTKKTKQKIGLANSISLKGYKQTKEHSQNMGDALKGEKNGNWKDGRSKEKGYKNFLNLSRQLLNKKIGGSHSYQQWQELKAKFGFMCLCCKKSEPEITLSIDHIIPLTKGGSDNIKVVYSLCYHCPPL